MNPLEALQQRFEEAQARPPELANPKRTVRLPERIRTQRDSRGRVRPMLRSQPQARTAAVEAAKREMVAGAKTELVTKAREQLKP